MKTVDPAPSLAQEIGCSLNVYDDSIILLSVPAQLLQSTAEVGVVDPIHGQIQRTQMRLKEARPLKPESQVVKPCCYQVRSLLVQSS